MEIGVFAIRSNNRWMNEGAHHCCWHFRTSWATFVCRFSHSPAAGHVRSQSPAASCSRAVFVATYFQFAFRAVLMKSWRRQMPILFDRFGQRGSREQCPCPHHWLRVNAFQFPTNRHDGHEFWFANRNDHRIEWYHLDWQSRSLQYDTIARILLQEEILKSVSVFKVE